MPCFDINIINASYYRKSTSLNYWADGHGRRVEGYIISLAQLKTKLSSKFRLSQLISYTVVDRKLRPIVSENRLLAALSRVQKGGTLLINVYEHEPMQHLPHLKSQFKRHPHNPRTTPSHQRPSTTRPHSTSSTSSKQSPAPVSRSRTKHNSSRNVLPRNTNLALTKLR